MLLLKNIPSTLAIFDELYNTPPFIVAYDDEVSELDDFNMLLSIKSAFICTLELSLAL